MSGSLGRRVPPDWEHVDKHPLTTTAAKALEPSPVAIGVNWYSAFDRPDRDSHGHWWVGRSGDLGSIRGGHCVALKPRHVVDPAGWWDFYDQGSEGACVGFGVSRVMSLMNRKRYFARWLWDRAKEVDPWPETKPGDDQGTLVRSALDIVKNRGHVVWREKYDELNTDGEGGDAYPRSGLQPVVGEGIAAYRWIRSIDDLVEVLGDQGLGYVEFVNSWGRSYPHVTRMPLDVIERLWREDGELGVVVDR